MGNLPIRLVCFDLNGTLIHENSWQKLNLAMGVSDEEDLELLHLYQEGTISYQAGLDRLLPLYKCGGKFRKDTVEKALFAYSYVEGAFEIIKYLKEKKYQLAIISGSFDVLVEKVVKELGVSFWAANNRFVYDENGIGKTIKCYGNDDEFKVDKLQEMCKALNIDVTQCACVGDSENDRKIFALTQHGIAIKDSSVEKDAWKIIGTLEEMKEIL